MRPDKNAIPQMKTKVLKTELARADAIFWAWQADGPKPTFNVDKYIEELDEELANRGHYDV